MLVGKHANGKPKYYTGNGKVYLLDEEGFSVREVTNKKELKQVEDLSWEELWEEFGEGLEEYEC